MFVIEALWLILFYALPVAFVAYLAFIGLLLGSARLYALFFIPGTIFSGVAITVYKTYLFPPAFIDPKWSLCAPRCLLELELITQAGFAVYGSNIFWGWIIVRELVVHQKSWMHHSRAMIWGSLLSFAFGLVYTASVQFVLPIGVIVIPIVIAEFLIRLDRAIWSARASIN